MYITLLLRNFCDKYPKKQKFTCRPYGYINTISYITARIIRMNVIYTTICKIALWTYRSVENIVLFLMVRSDVISFALCYHCNLPANTTTITHNIYIIVLLALQNKYSSYDKQYSQECVTVICKTDTINHIHNRVP